MNKGPAPTDAEKSKAYTTAQRKLREAHQEEFYDLLEAEYKEINYEWKRPQSAEQKAMKAIASTLDGLDPEKARDVVRELIQQNPELAGQVLPASGEGVQAAVDSAIASEARARREEAAADAAAVDDAEIPEGVDPWGEPVSND